MDNGSQFKSRGERLNNFELFCAAYNIQIVNSTPYRPQGKGKIERFYETVENQFITWARARITDEPKYTLTRLNRDLDGYLRDQYHVRVHGATKETPNARFSRERLRTPDPPVDVVKFLERNSSRMVNKFGEVSFKGYKIQVSLPARTRVTVVETIETVRIEHTTGLIREIKTKELSKNPEVKRQNGVRHTMKKLPPEKSETKYVHQRRAIKGKLIVYGPDERGYYTRVTNAVGMINWLNKQYYIGRKNAGKHVFIRVVGTEMQVFDEDANHLISFTIEDAT
nr:hypothetical protein [Candidatus Sigynarchaeota archaeon]